MAINIGELNLTVDADTTGLRRAVNALRQLRSVVDQTAAAQTAGSRAAANALSRQESALQGALDRAKSLRQELTAAGASQQTIKQVSDATEQLSREMTSGQLSSAQFRRSMADFNTTIGKTRRDLRNLKFKDTTAETDRFAASLKNLNTIGRQDLTVQADTASLKESVRLMQDFRKVVNDAARSQERGSSAAANALGRQESATRKAFTQVRTLRTELKAAGAASSDLARLSTGFKRLVREMTSGRLSAVEFRRSMDAFNSTIETSRRQLRRLRLDRQQQQANGLVTAFQNLRSASVLAIGPLSRLGAAVEAVGAIANRSNFVVAGFIGGLVGISVAAGLLVRNAVRSGTEMERFEARVRIATGTTQSARDAIDEVSDVAKRLGLDLRSSIKGFSSLAAASRGTSLEGQGVKNVFEGVAAAAAALRLEAPQVEGAIRAIEQMMSKGTVQAEELRGQLGERLPGAFQLAAIAMDTTTQELNKMLEQGEVISEDFLPRFSRILKLVFEQDAKRFAESFTGSVNGLRTAIFEFGANLDRVAGISSAFASAIRVLAGGVQFAADNMILFVQSVGALAGAMLGLGLGVALTAARTLAFATAIGTATRAVITFTAVLLANPIGAFATITSGAVVTLVRLAAAAGGAVVGFKLLNRTTQDSVDSVDDLEDAFQQLAAVQREVGVVSAQAQQALLTGLQAEADVIAQQIQRDADRLERLQREAREFRERPTGDPNIGAAQLDINARRVAQAEEEVAEALTQQEEALRRINDMRERAAAFKVLDPDDFKGISEDADSAVSEVDQFIQKLLAAQQNAQQLQAILSDPTATNNLEALNRALQVEEIRGELAQLSQNELQELAAKTGVAATSAMGLADAFADIFVQQEQLQEQISETQRALEQTPEVMEEIREELAKLRGETVAMAAGPDAFEQFEDLRTESKFLEEFREKLEQINVVGREQEEIINELTEAFRANRQAAEQLEDTKDIIASMEKVTRDVIGGVGDAIVNMLKIGSKEAISFGDVMVSVINDITEALLRMAVIEPFIKEVVGMVSGSLQQGGGGDFLSQAATVAGNFFGNVATSAHGNVFTSPGLTTIGEQGAEAVLPLERGPGGMLGVRASGGGGGGNVVVNIINQSGEQLQAQQQQSRTNADGTLIVDVMVKGAIERLDGRGQLDRVFSRHNAPRRGQF